MMKGKQLYSGKAKTLYDTDQPDVLITAFRDDATAFNGVKHDRISKKGAFNNAFNAFMMQYLESQGVKTHLVKQLSDTECAVKKLKMIPVECVMRNRAAGSICKRLGIEEGKVFEPPVFEFFLKNDELGDPFINTSHILTFDWASQDDLTKMKALTLKVNEILQPLFEKAGLWLVDFKLEFGRFGDDILLGDELTPDGCRIWDAQTQERLDKDRFRHDLGDLLTGYTEVAQRLGVPLHFSTDSKETMR